MKIARKIFIGFFVLLVVASIALNSLQIFGKGNLKPSSWFGSNIEQVQSVNGKDGKDGVNGKDGAPGLDGADGVDGQNGQDGETPYIGENGNWFIGEVDTGVKAAGQDGKDGAPGADGVDGKDGADGESPYIGENGNWFIGEVDTGVKATGQDGAGGATVYQHTIRLVVQVEDGEIYPEYFLVLTLHTSNATPITAQTLWGQIPQFLPVTVVAISEGSSTFMPLAIQPVPSEVGEEYFCLVGFDRAENTGVATKDVIYIVTIIDNVKSI